MRRKETQSAWLPQLAPGRRCAGSVPLSPVLSPHARRVIRASQPQGSQKRAPAQRACPPPLSETQKVSGPAGGQVRPRKHEGTGAWEHPRSPGISEGKFLAVAQQRPAPAAYTARRSRRARFVTGRRTGSPDRTSSKRRSGDPQQGTRALLPRVRPQLEADA